MPAHYLTERHQTHGYTLRLLHYPPLSTAPKPGQIRAGAHSDYGTLTLLFQDEVGGLEVLSTQGEWMAAPAIPGAVLINTGDLTQRWSNNVFRSTKHRVALPQDQSERSLFHRLFLPARCRHRNRLPADLPEPREPAPIPSCHRWGLSTQPPPGHLLAELQIQVRRFGGADRALPIL